jgi:hypothetical protein
MPTDLDSTLEALYDGFDGSPLIEEYMQRHAITSAGILTVTTDEVAAMVSEYLHPRIEGKTVIEIGGGLGLLALHMGAVAKRVYCIEANPIWASSFVALLVAHKPKNVSYLFGSADEFSGQITGDVAIFCTHSGVAGMRQAASLFAPMVIDVYGEIIAANPEAFDKTARLLRSGSL